MRPSLTLILFTLAPALSLADDIHSIVIIPIIPSFAPPQEDNVHGKVEVGGGVFAWFERAMVLFEERLVDFLRSCLLNRSGLRS